MMKLSPLFEMMLHEKKIRYDLSSVNGGFSDGVDVNVTKKVGTIGISVNIYGGGNLNYLSFKTPTSVIEYQDALIAAMRTGDPVTSELSAELNVYKKAIKKAVSLAMVGVLRKFDEEARNAINTAVAGVNATYGQTRDDAPVKPKVAKKVPPTEAPAPVANTQKPIVKPQIKQQGNAKVANPKQVLRRNG